MWLWPTGNPGATSGNTWVIPITLWCHRTWCAGKFPFIDVPSYKPIGMSQAMISPCWGHHGAPMAWHGIPKGNCLDRHGTAWIAGIRTPACTSCCRTDSAQRRSSSRGSEGKKSRSKAWFQRKAGRFWRCQPYEYLNIKHLSQQKSRKWRKCSDVSSSAWCFPTFSHLFGCQLLGIFPFHREPRARDEAAVVDVAGHQGEEAAALQLLDLVIDLLQLSWDFTQDIVGS